jgi:hypothetical protein
VGWDLVLGLALMVTSLNPSSARRLATSSSSITTGSWSMGPNLSMLAGVDGWRASLAQKR